MLKNVSTRMRKYLFLSDITLNFYAIFTTNETLKESVESRCTYSDK